MVDRYNPFLERQKEMSAYANQVKNQAAELAYSSGATRPYVPAPGFTGPQQPVPEPGTPPPNYLTPHKYYKPNPNGRTPPIYVPPVEWQYAGRGTQTGFSGNAAFDQASPAQQMRNKVRGRRNAFAGNYRNYMLGPRQGRGGRVPVFSYADAARRQKLIGAAGAATRPPVAAPRTYTPRVHQSILLGML